MAILGLHHAQITIPTGQESAARDFYCRLLGLQEIPKPESLQGRGGFWLDLGSQQVHVGTEDGVNRRAGKAHLAYQVNDLGAFVSRLEAAGIGVERGVPIPGHDRVELRDPFGNRLELIEQLSGD